MSRGRKFEDKVPNEEEMEGDVFDEEEYEYEMESDHLDEDEFDHGIYEEEEDSDFGPWILCKGPPPKTMMKCDWILSSGSQGRLDSPINMDVKSQDADYFSLPQLSDELETMIMARFPILEFRKLCLLNKRFLELTKNGDLLKERKTIGVREALVFMLASGEENWWAFDQRFTSHKALPMLPCDDAFKFGDKESLCAGTHLLICGYEVNGPSIWTYDVIMNKWYKGLSMFEPRCLFASASCGDFAFIAGGIGMGMGMESNQVLNSAEKYDPRTKTWDPIPGMKERRKMCSGVYMDNKFYVLGGQDKNGNVLTCGEVFHEERNMWVKIPGMLNGLTLATSQSPPLVAVVNNELYLFEPCSNCLMVYLKDRNSWKDLGPVPVRADINNGWGVAFKSLGDKLLVIGGSTITLSGRGMTMYKCVPNPNAERLRWVHLGGGVGNTRSHFIMNCTVMVT